MNDAPEVVAGRIADGESIDWEEAIRKTPDDRGRRLIRHLRLVASVARVHSSFESETMTETAERTLTTWGPLELRELLGSGTYGEVYRAWDRRLEREVALKLLKPDRAKDRPDAAAVEEGRLLAKLRHRNVVTVFGAEIHDGRVGIWMELIRGRSLEQIVREQGALGPREAALIGVDLCRALAAVHQARVVHRDVKADNVLREEGGRIVLTDFGAGFDDQSETSAGLSGTAFYIAPELFRGVPANPKSDLYALGVLLYHLVTGSFPVEARSWPELRDKHARGEAKLLRDRRPDLSEAFVRSVERAVARDPEARFATAGQMEQALALALGAEEVSTETGTPQRVGPTIPPRLLLWAAGALTLALLLILAVFLLPSTRPPADETVAVPTGRPTGALTGTYSIKAALYRTPAGEGARELVEPGAKLSIGDSLTLEVEASAPLHLYVIDEDEAGHAFALFPLPGFEPRNPLPAGVRHVLPGVREGKAQSWSVDTAGGQEHLLVLASPDRLVEFEAEMNSLAKPGDSAVPIPESSIGRLRGIGGLSERRPAASSGDSAGKLFEMADRMSQDSESVRGVWVRRIDLENPRPK